jgi:hypothetical protein
MNVFYILSYTRRILHLFLFLTRFLSVIRRQEISLRLVCPHFNSSQSLQRFGFGLDLKSQIRNLGLNFHFIIQ